MAYVFADCELDCERLELRRNGTAIHLEPQVFDVLVHLVRNHDRVVTKDELLQAVWNGRVVSEDALTSRISAARRAIGDTGEDQQLIRTVQRRGFRFVGHVGEQSTGGENGGGRHPSHGSYRKLSAAGRQFPANVRRRAPGGGIGRQRTAPGQDRQLAQSSRVRLAKSGVVAIVSAAGRAMPADSLR